MKTYPLETVVSVARSLSPYYRELYKDVPHEGWTMTGTFGYHLAESGPEKGDRVANLFYAGELYSSFLFLHDSLQGFIDKGCNTSTTR